MKVVINTSYGGFGLSYEAKKQYLAKQGKEAFCFATDFKTGGYKIIPTADTSALSLIVADISDFDTQYNAIPERTEERNEFYKAHVISAYDLERTDPILISVIEEFGAEICSGSLAKLQIVEIPDDVQWEIQDYDGAEWIAEKHRTWS